MSLIAEGHNLFVIDIDYIVPLEQVEPHMDGHLAFVNKGYDKGLFLATGPKVPRTGGVILAQSTTKEEIEKLIAEDPFHQHNLARFRVTEFHPRRTVEGF